MVNPDSNDHYIIKVQKSSKSSKVHNYVTIQASAHTHTHTINHQLLHNKTTHHDHIQKVVKSPLSGTQTMEGEAIPTVEEHLANFHVSVVLAVHAHRRITILSG